MPTTDFAVVGVGVVSSSSPFLFALILFCSLSTTSTLLSSTLPYHLLFLAACILSFFISFATTFEICSANFPFSAFVQMKRRHKHGNSAYYIYTHILHIMYIWNEDANASMSLRSFVCSFIDSTSSFFCSFICLFVHFHRVHIYFSENY